MTRSLRDEIQKAVREADSEDYMLTDAQLDAIVSTVDRQVRKIARLYERGEIYTGKRGL